MIDSDLYAKLENLIEEFIYRSCREHISCKLPEVVANRTENGDESLKVLDAIADFDFIGKFVTHTKLSEIIPKITENVSEKIIDESEREFHLIIEDMLYHVESELQKGDYR